MVAQLSAHGLRYIGTSINLSPTDFSLDSEHVNVGCINRVYYYMHVEEDESSTVIYDGVVWTR
jgi:hypothetical protein